MVSVAEATSSPPGNRITHSDNLLDKHCRNPNRQRQPSQTNPVGGGGWIRDG